MPQAGPEPSGIGSPRTAAQRCPGGGGKGVEDRLAQEMARRKQEDAAALEALQAERSQQEMAIGPRSKTGRIGSMRPARRFGSRPLGRPVLAPEDAPPIDARTASPGRRLALAADAAGVAIAPANPPLPVDPGRDAAAGAWYRGPASPPPGVRWWRALARPNRVLSERASASGHVSSSAPSPVRVDAPRRQLLASHAALGGEGDYQC